MLTALIAVHCTIAGMVFVYFYLMEKFGSALGDAFGLPDKKTPIWQYALGAAIWELYLLAGFLKNKFQ